MNLRVYVIQSLVLFVRPIDAVRRDKLTKQHGQIKPRDRQRERERNIGLVSVFNYIKNVMTKTSQTYQTGSG